MTNSDDPLIRAVRKAGWLSGNEVRTLDAHSPDHCLLLAEAYVECGVLQRVLRTPTGDAAPPGTLARLLRQIERNEPVVGADARLQVGYMLAKAP